MSVDNGALDLSKHLCAGCSYYSAAPLCPRCEALVKSGENRGPLPSYALERAPRAQCWACSGARSSPPDPTRAVFCARHAEAYERARKVTPLEFDKPQVPHVVGSTFATRPHFFF